jgi:acyl-CoA thioester hydrolase
MEAGIKYKSPAYYDDLLNVEAVLKQIYSAKVHIEYKIKRDADDILVVEGFTTHMFINVNTKKPTKPPQIYIESLSKYFEN